MAIQTADGIILKRQDLRETSIILTFLTRDFGKVSGVIKGARGPKAVIGGNPQVFSLNNLVFYERKRGNLNSIAHCDLKDFFGSIRSDLERTVYADYFLELVDTVMTDGDVDGNVYDLLLNSLKLLSKDVSPKRVARIFEIKLMDLSGFMPDLGECTKCSGKIAQDAVFSLKTGDILCERCGRFVNQAIRISKGALNFIERVRKSPFDMVSRVKVSQDVGRVLETFMRKFVDYHIQRDLKTLDFLKKIKM